MRLTMNKRKAVTREYPRYQKASKKEKIALLDKFTTLTGYHRKYVARQPKRKGKQLYSGEVIECLRRIWTFF